MSGRPIGDEEDNGDVYSYQVDCYDAELKGDVEFVEGNYYYHRITDGNELHQAIINSNNHYVINTLISANRLTEFAIINDLETNVLF